MLYCAALYEDMKFIMKFTKLIIMDLAFRFFHNTNTKFYYILLIFITKNKRIGFEKVILDIDS